MSNDKICTLCGLSCPPRALKCVCGATLPGSVKSTVRKEIYDEPKESYDEYYARQMRWLPEKHKIKILTPQMAQAMVEEIREARASGDTSEEMKRYISLRNFSKMFIRRN